MLKEKFQKSIILSLALTGVALAMDAAPKPKAEEAIQELRKDPNSLFSGMPKDLDAQIGKYKPVVTINCPTGEELTQAQASDPGNAQFALKVANTPLAFQVFINTAQGPYKFVSVDIMGGPQSFVQCHYTTSDGAGKVTATLSVQELKSHNVDSCRAVSTIEPKRITKDFFKYSSPTSNAKDIAIECLRG